MSQVQNYLLKKSDLDRFKELILLFEEVFEMKNFVMPPDHHLQKLLSQERFFVFVAIENDEVIGGLTTYTLEQYYSEKPLAYIYDLAVSTSHQRRGIGRSLIDSINSYCRAQGFEEVFVQADRVDDYALDFYRSTQPTEEEDVLHFYYNLE